MSWASPFKGFRPTEEKLQINGHLQNTSNASAGYYLAPPQNVREKHSVKNAKLMLYMPLFIVHAVKDLLKVILQYKNETL